MKGIHVRPSNLVISQIPRNIECILKRKASLKLDSILVRTLNGLKSNITESRVYFGLNEQIVLNLDIILIRAQIYTSIQYYIISNIL